MRRNYFICNDEIGDLKHMLIEYGKLAGRNEYTGDN